MAKLFGFSFWNVNPSPSTSVVSDAEEKQVERRFKLRFHYQNLNERPSGKPGPPSSGRCWLGLRRMPEYLNLGEFRFEWNLCPKWKYVSMHIGVSP